MFFFRILNSSVFEKNSNNGKVQKKHTGTGTSKVQHNNSTYSEKEFYHNDRRDLCFLILVVVYPSSDNGSSANNSEAFYHPGCWIESDQKLAVMLLNLWYLHSAATNHAFLSVHNVPILFSTVVRNTTFTLSTCPTFAGIRPAFLGSSFCNIIMTSKN